MKTYASLHTHSHYSLLDSVIKVEEGVKHCLANGISSLAITDHGSMGGIVNFSDICEKNKLPFIVGCEAYISVGEHNSKDFLEVDSWGDEGSKRKTNYHLTLLAKNLEGYLNLCRMSYIAHTEGFYYKPRVSFGTLAKHSKGLIALSGCLGGMLASAARDEDPIKATREVAQQHKDIFDEDYYLELQSHNIPAQINLNKHCIALSKELDIPLVATTDAHFILKGNKHLHDCIMCIQTGDTLDNPDRFQLEESCYMMPAEEMYKAFPIEAVTNTLEVAEKCTFKLFDHFNSKKPIFPSEKQIVGK